MANGRAVIPRVGREGICHAADAIDTHQDLSAAWAAAAVWFADSTAFECFHCG
jgi:hypothetical protein